MKLSIIIVNWNTGDLLAGCLDSLYNHPPSCPFEVWVVDNASKDDSFTRLDGRYDPIHLVQTNMNAGFARGNNIAARQTEGEYLLLLNPDTVVHPGAIDKMVAFLDENPRAGAVGPRLLNADGSTQPSAYPMPTLGRELWRLFHLDRVLPVALYPASLYEGPGPRRVDGLTGACMLVRAGVVSRASLFDEAFFIYSEEVDLCARITQAGYELYYLPTGTVIHYGGMSTRQTADAMFLELYKNKVKFFRKHNGPLQAGMYRRVLELASLARICSCSLLALAPSPRRQQYQTTTRQYRALLAALKQFS